jgi:hypothetical protein
MLALSGAFGPFGGGALGFGRFERIAQIIRNIIALPIVFDAEAIVFRRISAQIFAKSVTFLPTG